MTASLLFGALAGLGVYLLVRVFVRPRPGLATTLARIESGQRSMSTHTVVHTEADLAGTGLVQSLVDRLGDRLEVLAVDRGWELGSRKADLALMGRTRGAHLAAQVTVGGVLFLLAPLVWACLRLVGVPLPSTLPLLAALLLGLLGFYLPNLVLRSEAAVRRRDFRRSVGIFLDLVSMNLAGGRGLPEALLAASTVSEHWTLVRIRQALANARLYGTTPWVALGDLGREIGVEELQDLSGALALAADDGAKIRASLSARAATIRRKELAQAEGEEGEKSQSMLVAQMLISTAFLIFLAYPAVAQLLRA